MNRKKQTIIHVLTDLISVAFVWVLFFSYRDIYIEKSEVVIDSTFYKGLIFVTVFWMLFYIIQGTYINPLRNYRLKAIFATLLASVIGSLVIFLVLLLDDIENLLSYKQYYQMLVILFGLHLVLTLIPRLIITTYQVKKIHKGLFGFNTIIIGGSDKAIDILSDLKNLKQNSGHRIIGFVNINGNDFKLKAHIPLLGHLDTITNLIKDRDVKEVIIALESSEHKKLNDIITKLSAFDLKINIEINIF